MEGDLTPIFMSHSNESGPRVYVACLSSYNAGILHGRWFDAARETEELREEITLMLEESPTPIAEEWAIHDHEGFSPLSVSEHEDLDQLCEAAKLITEYGSIAAHLMDLEGGFGCHETARKGLEERYIGAHSSVADWVEEQLDEGLHAEIPEHLRPYIDGDRLARDIELSGDIDSFDVEGTVHLFYPST